MFSQPWPTCSSARGLGELPEGRRPSVKEVLLLLLLMMAADEFVALAAAAALARGRGPGLVDGLRPAILAVPVDRGPTAETRVLRSSRHRLRGPLGEARTEAEAVACVVSLLGPGGAVMLEGRPGEPLRALRKDELFCWLLRPGEGSWRR